MKKVITTTIVVAFMGSMLAFIPAKGAYAESDIEKSSEAIERAKEGDFVKAVSFVCGTSWGATKRKPWSGAMALGPYVSVMPGTNDIIDVIGVGIVVGFIGGRSAEADTNKFSMNIAAGGYVDPGTRILADDFEDGKAPPEGEITIRYKTIAQYGAQGMLSFSYNF
jgi:hypothetical protein